MTFAMATAIAVVTIEVMVVVGSGPTVAMLLPTAVAATVVADGATAAATR